MENVRGAARAYRRARIRLINREHRCPRQRREGKITGNRKLIADLVSGGSRTRPDPAGRAGCFITLNTIDPKTARSLARSTGGRERVRLSFAGDSQASRGYQAVSRLPACTNLRTPAVPSIYPLGIARPPIKLSAILSWTERASDAAEDSTCQRRSFINRAAN